MAGASCRGVIAPDQLGAAQNAVHRYFPTPTEVAELGGTEAGEWHTWDAPWPEFPFHSARLNALVLHDNVIDLAEAFLGTPDLACYMGIVTAKYARQASGYNQLLHADYPNHMLVVPRHERGFQQVEFFVYLTDVTTEDGATRFVSWQKTKDIPVERHTLNYVDYAALYDDASDAAAPAGSVVAYRPDVYHRSVDHTDPSRYRVDDPRIVPPSRRRVGRVPGLAVPRLLTRARQVRAECDPAPAGVVGLPAARTSLLGRGDDRRRRGALPGPRHVPVACRADRLTEPAGRRQAASRIRRA